MIIQKLIINKIILKKECSGAVKDFYDPFASFYVLPILQTPTAEPLLLVKGRLKWAHHMIHVSYNNTRQLKKKEYVLDTVEDFKLHLHLVHQKASTSKSWKQIEKSFEVPVVENLLLGDFTSYLLAIIPVDWKELTYRKYENDLLEIELMKSK